MFDDIMIVKLCFREVGFIFLFYELLKMLFIRIFLNIGFDNYFDFLFGFLI